MNINPLNIELNFTAPTAAPLTAIEIAEEDLRLAQTITQANLASVPKNTEDAYEPKIREYIAWAQERYTGSDQVTGEKLAFYLEQVVHGRGKKRKRKEEQDGVTVGGSTVKLYRAAITKLYTRQVALGVNSAPHPRDCSLLNELMKRVCREKTAVKRANLEDRGKSTLIDGYSNLEELNQVFALLEIPLMILF